MNAGVIDNLQYLYDNRFNAADFGADGTISHATADLTCSLSWQDVVGGSITLSAPGRYFVLGGIHGKFSAAAVAHAISGRLTVGGTAQTGVIDMHCPNGDAGNAEATVYQGWDVTITTATAVAALQATNINNASDVVKGGNTFVMAIPVKRP
jgi:hypothetical protein